MAAMADYNRTQVCFLIKHGKIKAGTLGYIKRRPGEYHYGWEPCKVHSVNNVPDIAAGLYPFHVNHDVPAGHKFNGWGFEHNDLWRFRNQTAFDILDDIVDGRLPHDMEPLLNAIKESVTLKQSEFAFSTEK